MTTNVVREWAETEGIILLCVSMCSPVAAPSLHYNTLFSGKILYTTSLLLSPRLTSSGASAAAPLQGEIAGTTRGDNEGERITCL